jgi:hypothetical protein
MAAARQKEMKLSITDVAMTTRVVRSAGGVTCDTAPFDIG